MELHPGQPAADEPLHRPVGGQRPRNPKAPANERVLVRPRGQPRQLPVHVHTRATVAEEPPRQQRRRSDPGRRRRRPQPQLPQPLGLRRGGLVVHPVQRHLPGPGAAVGAGDPGDGGSARPDRVRVPGQLPLQRPLPALRRGPGHPAPPHGRVLLHPEGWRTSPPTADDPIYYAMSGNLGGPAIADFHPGLSSDVLYVTNGETTDYAHAVTGALAWTPELSAGCDGCGFVFPDAEGVVQAEFERNLPFARSVADSAVDPDDPKTVTGITTKPFYVDSDDPYKSSNPGVQLSFTKSYGDPQPVAVIAKRSLGAVTAKYSINGGAPQSAPMSEGEGGAGYDPASVYYHQMRGVVTGTDPGDSVEVWFEGGGEVSDSFTYDAVSESGNQVLVVAAEDYTGASPGQDPAGPHFATQSPA